VKDGNIMRTGGAKVKPIFEDLLPLAVGRSQV
jgi:hypothetical protein